ncbi:hypothetical protein ACFRSX_30960 [Streptomyces goshikiensis]|uniref:hypothetical protein n=1 Tax=Streptomyces TaxID=1883 RepID=UPI001F468000|nr:hypothetical protein [Streptomyces sp. CB02120-2]
MELHVIERSANASQQGLTERQILAVIRRAFGPSAEVRSARELSGGMYNTTYRIDLADREEPVVLRGPPKRAASSAPSGS